MDDQGETPLSRSFKTSYPFLVDLLLSQERQYALQEGENERYSQADQGGYWGLGKAVDALVSGKASARRQSKLLQAICDGDAETVSSMVEQGADLHEMDENGLTTLHWAALSGQTDVAEYLLDHGAEINPPMPGSRLSPTGIALLMGYQDLFERLVVRGGKPS